MRLLALAGAKGSGKDTVAAYLAQRYGFERVAFADPLRAHIYTLNPWVLDEYHLPMRLQTLVDIYGWEEAKKNPEVRRLLQVYGTEVVRDQIDPNLWITLANHKVRNARGSDVAITDLRFQNENAWVERIGAKRVLVVRPGFGGGDAHRSENDLKDVKFDHVLHNTGTIDDLHEAVEKMLKEFCGE